MTWLCSVSSYPLPRRTVPCLLLPRYARRLLLLRGVLYADHAHGPESHDPEPDSPEPDSPELGWRQTDGPDTERPVQAGLAIEVDTRSETTTVFINGELDLVTKTFFAERLMLVLRKKPGRLVLDMERTGFMDCGCAQVIAATLRSLPEGGCLVIRRPGPGIRRVLELTGLEAYCETEK